MKFLKKYFYSLMFVLCIISFFYESKVLLMFLLLTTLVIYYRELEFGNLHSYTKEQTYIAIKRVAKEFFYFLFGSLAIVAIVVLLTTNLKNYLLPLYITFFVLFAISAHTIFNRRSIIIRFIEFLFNFFDTHFISWCILVSIIITKKNLYLYEDLIIILIPIFTFLPPVVSLIDKEGTFQKKLIKYSIFLIINLLFLIIFDKMNIQNFYFDANQGNLIPILLSLFKLLCTSFSYFFITQITYLSIKFCVTNPNR